MSAVDAETKLLDDMRLDERGRNEIIRLLKERIQQSTESQPPQLTSPSR